jgi:bifunctional non-homologous end joining protein LigD
MGLEGIVSKRADAPYRSGRGEQWLKVNCWKRERFVVIGFVPEGSSGLLKLRLARRAGRDLGLCRPRGMGPKDRRDRHHLLHEVRR